MVELALRVVFRAAKLAYRWSDCPPFRMETPRRSGDHPLHRAELRHRSSGIVGRHASMSPMLSSHQTSMP
jgi:hypothetical protein